MWRWMVLLLMLYCPEAKAQKKWDGGAGTSDWSQELNWFPDGVPGPDDDVLLNNDILTGSYTVDLPSGSITVTIRTLAIQPGAAVIALTLPSSNNANPGLSVTGPGDALIIHSGGIFRNASGATTGSGLLVSSMIRINNGGKYIHQTPRSNAGLIDRLSTAEGTARGIFEFDVPGTAGYTVSLTGNNFGSLSFNGAASGSSKSYSGSGIGTLLIRGDLTVHANAQLTSTLSADIVIGGNLTVDGKLNLHPSTSGTVSRSLRFMGNDAHFQGKGTLSLNASFRNIEVAKNAVLCMDKILELGTAQHAFVCRGTVDLKDNYIAGAGSFQLLDSATLITGNEQGIASTLAQGAVRTGVRSFGSKANYVFDGTLAQVTGDALPDTVSSLGVDNGALLSLTKHVYVRDSLCLVKGKILSSVSSLLTMGTSKVRSPGNAYGAVNQGWESGFVDGPMGLHTLAGISYVAPIGKAGIFAPVILTRVDPGEQTVIMQYNPTAHNVQLLGNDLIKISSTEHWQLLNAASSKYLFAISYRPTSLETVGGEVLTIGAISSGSNSWKAVASKQTGQGQGWLAADSALIDAIVLTVGAATPTVLPLRLINFSGQQDGRRIVLNWLAEEEGKDIDYVVERSSDGIRFTMLSTVSSRRRQLARHYFSDDQPLAVNYYRLRLADGGTDAFSRTVKITHETKQLQLYPNPATEQITINFPRSRSKFEVEIVSLTGTVCKKFVCNTATCQIRVNDLRRGFYFVRLTDQFGSITLQLTKD